MPELPEVEVIRLNLSKKIIGCKIQKVSVLLPKSFIGNPNLVEGEKVVNVWRKAKMLGIDLQNLTLLIHLKMSGQIIWEKSQSVKEQKSKRFIGGHPTQDMQDTMPNTHTRVIFSFADGSHLFFNDQRKFGWIKLMKKGPKEIKSLLKTLGPEPLDKEFTWQLLKQNLLKRKSMPVKVALMDQAVVAGIGNIYSNEACFLASIDPRTKVANLTDENYKVLFEGLKKSLKDSIRHGGSTSVHFVDPDGRKGYFLDYAFVYGRSNLPCKVCKTGIRKIQLGQRGTYFCTNCQKQV